jgi:hypothetical protein
VVKGRLHSAADASPAATLLLLQIQPGILSRRALPPGRLDALGATPAFHHGLLEQDGELLVLEQLDLLAQVEAQLRAVHHHAAHREAARGQVSAG